MHAFGASGRSKLKRDGRRIPVPQNIRRTHHLGWATVCLALGAGCGTEPDEIEIASAAQAIKEGDPSPDDHAVVSILDQAAGRLCTGTLITSNLVLTARHCVSQSTSGGVVVCGETQFNGPSAPGGFFVATDETLTDDSDFHKASAIITLSDGAAFCGSDVALIVIADPIPAAQATPILPRLDEPPAPDEVFSAVGFGAIDDEGTDAGTRRRRDGLVLECVGDACPSATALTPAVADGEFLADEGVCVGDSGGPAIDAQGRVFGVTSRGLADCVKPVYGSTFSHAAWLRDGANIAAGIGELEPPAWSAASEIDPKAHAPIGQACNTPADCYTGICNFETTQYCSRPCDEVSTCPQGYQCSADAVCTSRQGGVAQVRPRDESCSVVAPGQRRRGSASGRTVGWSVLLAGFVLSCWRRRLRS